LEVSNNDRLRERISINQAKESDTRVTKLGRFLRRTSRDELAQSINVLQGQMSIVDPVHMP
jgi:putative colanic acid biosynthesis UDP-glucose lipid carrier transferase